MIKLKIQIFECSRLFRIKKCCHKNCKKTRNDWRNNLNEEIPNLKLYACYDIRSLVESPTYNLRFIIQWGPIHSRIKRKLVEFKYFSAIQSAPLLSSAISTNVVIHQRLWNGFLDNLKSFLIELCLRHCHWTSIHWWWVISMIHVGHSIFSWHLFYSIKCIRICEWVFGMRWRRSRKCFYPFHFSLH